MMGDGVYKNTAIVCDPSVLTSGVGSAIAQYDLNGYTLSDLVVHSTTGTRNLMVWQAGGNTTMTWDRDVRNGDEFAAQLDSPGMLTIWAIGNSNSLRNTTGGLPLMGQRNVTYMLSSPSVTPTPTATVSVGASSSPTPSVVVSPSPSSSPYLSTVTLTAGLKLSWTRLGDVYSFQAVLSSRAWYVS